MPKVKNIEVQRKYMLINELIANGYRLTKKSSNLEILGALAKHTGDKLPDVGLMKGQYKEILRTYLRLHYGTS